MFPLDGFLGGFSEIIHTEHPCWELLLAISILGGTEHVTSQHGRGGKSVWGSGIWCHAGSASALASPWSLSPSYSDHCATLFPPLYPWYGHDFSSLSQTIHDRVWQWQMTHLVSLTKVLYCTWFPAITGWQKWTGNTHTHTSTHKHMLLKLTMTIHLLFPGGNYRVNY